MSWLVIVYDDLERLALALLRLICFTGVSQKPVMISLTSLLSRVDYWISTHLFVTFLAFYFCAPVFFGEVLMNLFIPCKLASKPESGFVQLLGHLSSLKNLLFRVS